MKIVVENDKNEMDSVKELIEVYTRKLREKEEEADKKDIAEIRTIGNNFRSVMVMDEGCHAEMEAGPELVEEMCGLMVKHADEIIGIGKAVHSLLKAVPGLRTLLKASSVIMKKNLGIKNMAVTRREKTA